eukprot:9134014-Pyramimonas_sp.AAC.1
MGFHAAETHYVLEFTLHVLLVEFRPRLEHGSKLKEAGDALWMIRELLRECPRGNFTPQQTQSFVDSSLVAVRVMDYFGLAAKPKVHELSHMAHMCLGSGSPRSWAVWFEEGLNRWIAKISRAAHRSVWHRRVLCEFEQTYGLQGRLA